MESRNAKTIVADINRCAALIEASKGVSFERTGALYAIMHDLSAELEQLMSPYALK